MSPDGLRNSRPLVWVDRHGETQRLDVPPKAFVDLRLSPDGKRLAVEVWGEQRAEILIYDFERKNPTSIAAEVYNGFPVWTPDGERVIFGSLRVGEVNNLYWASADGTATPQRLTHSDRSQYPYSVSPDGRILAFVQGGLSTASDLYTLPLDDSGAAEPLLQTEFIETSPSFSPDGHWLAYVSDKTETRRREVFVLPYPLTATSARKQISDSGGIKPLWSKKGDELFYRNGPRLYSVPIQTKPTFKAGDPRLLLDKRFGDSPSRRGYDISPDGERFLFMELTKEEAAQGPVQQLIVVQNWFEELKRLAPAQSAAEN